MWDDPRVLVIAWELFRHLVNSVFCNTSVFGALHPPYWVSMTSSLCRFYRTCAVSPTTLHMCVFSLAALHLKCEPLLKRSSAGIGHKLPAALQWLSHRELFHLACSCNWLWVSLAHVLLHTCSMLDPRHSGSWDSLQCPCPRPWCQQPKPFPPAGVLLFLGIFSSVMVIFCFIKTVPSGTFHC